MNLAQFIFEGKKVRVVVDGNDYWFLAKDLCEALGIVWKGNDSIRSIKAE